MAAVHHYIVYLAAECNSTDPMTLLSRTLVYAWAPGDAGLVLPDDVGFPLFEHENAQAITIQIHYNNPSHTSGMLDSSGLRFYYITKERTHRAGVFQTGDPGVFLYDEDISAGLTKYEFTCPGDCASSFLATERRSGNEQGGGVTILAEGKHLL